MRGWTLSLLVAVASCGGDCGGSPASDAGAPEAPDAARDAGIPDAAGGRDVPRADVGPWCGDITPAGECQGDLLVYCADDGTVQQTDCASRGRRCAVQRTLGGFWCVGGPGSPCEGVPTDACEEGLACVRQVCAGGGPLPDAGAVDAASAPDAGLPGDAGGMRG